MLNPSTLRQAPAPEQVPDLPGDHEAVDFACTLINSRQNVSPKRLVPGPSAGQLEQLLSLAAAAPDHGLLTPWRFILVPTEHRHRLAEVFALALIDRDPDATLEQIEVRQKKGAPRTAAASGGGPPRSA